MAAATEIIMSMQNRLAERTTTALITGGTSGIGRAVADKLARLGIHAVVVGRNVERGEKTIAEIRAAGGAESLERGHPRVVDLLATTPLWLGAHSNGAEPTSSLGRAR